MYVVKVSKTGVRGNSRCCNNCIDALLKFGIKKVYYTIDKTESKVEKVKDMQKTHNSSGVRYLNRLQKSFRKK